MTLVFLIYAWFPYGGQQRDFLRVVNECLQRGHRIRIYTLKWQGDPPEGTEVMLVPVRALSRHRLYQRFTEWVALALRQNPADLVIGFNKMPGLDVYYAADPCFAERAQTQRGAYYRFTPRYRHFMAYENAVFGPGSRTRALILSPQQEREFSEHYPECRDRLFLLPPGISRDRVAPPDAVQQRAEIRQAFHAEFGITPDERLILQVGSGFRVKGVDRSLRAIAALPVEERRRVRYMLAGQDKAKRFVQLAGRLGIGDRCLFLGGRDDVPRLLLGADLLLHPAYSESAGYVLLEATVAGLPVLTTDTCGYAFHIEQAGSGQVCASPFSQQDLNARLLDMLNSPMREQWQQNGLRYAARADLYSMPQTAADLIQRFAAQEATARAVSAP